MRKSVEGDNRRLLTGVRRRPRHVYSEGVRMATAWRVDQEVPTSIVLLKVTRLVVRRPR